MENDLIFTGQNPVMINFNGDTEDIYAPVKTTSCDVDIVSPRMLDDLYSANLDEICVKIEKYAHKTEWVVVYDNKGSVKSLRYNPGPNVNQQFTITYSNLFYQDINGDFRFNGEVRDSKGVSEYVNLKFDLTKNYWVNDNLWDMDNGDWYFHNGVDSYKIHWTGTIHNIQKKTDTGWTTPVPYTKTDNGTSTDCAYSVEHIIRTERGLELVWGKKRYLWNSANLEWLSATPYADISGDDYVAMYGSHYNKIKNSDGTMIDTCVVNGSTSAWVAWLNPTDATFKKIIPLQPDWDFNSVFTDDSGYLYYQRNDGVILCWSWELGKWLEWARLVDADASPGTFHIDYIAPGITVKRVVVKYNRKDDMSVRTTMLYNFSAPKAHMEEKELPEMELKTIWEGYKMPNTYSQDVTLNLDEIMITSIDPVSIMKYLRIDRIYTRPNVVSYADFFGRVISYVMLHSNKVMVENTVSYGGAFTGDNGLLDLKFQVSNFWDEMGEPATVYEVVEELLRPFCMCLCYDDDTFQIYDRNRTGGERTFRVYECSPEGLLSYVGDRSENTADIQWKDNNIQNPLIEIGSTYGRVTGVASTLTPEYSVMAIDKIDYNDRDKYDVFDLNVQRNKSKGYEKTPGEIYPKINNKDYWYYLWNGVYVNDEYHLSSNSGNVNGYLNINGAYIYKTGQAGNPNDYGSILNFYGGVNNPTATGKEQPVEKGVEVKEKITAYAPDNGVPPEFLEGEDLDWVLSNTDPNTNATLTKTDTGSAKWGKSIDSSNLGVVYHQEYRNVALREHSEQTIDINIAHSYSRTGIDKEIAVMNNNTSDDNYFHLTPDEPYFIPTLESAKSRYFPYLWNADNIKFNYLYFSKYATGYDFGCREIWDRRKIYLYVRMGENSVMQYNGKEWVQGTAPSDANCFWLTKLMNGERCFHNEFRYNLIETFDGERYSITGDQYTYYTDKNNNVVDKHITGGKDHICPKYNSEEFSWYQYVNTCSEGSVSVNLPLVSTTTATVVCDVYASNLTGKTGMGTVTGDPGRFAVDYHYKVEGKGYYTGDGGNQEVVLSPDNVGDMYGRIMTLMVAIGFIPVNATYFKAEHLDLDISMSVPESNLGQVFTQSDIKYIADSRKNYTEEFTTAPFRVNTFNNLVLSSFSYLIFGDDLADPGDFVIKGIGGRPEGYVVQAYMNWLGVIRKTYSKTIIPSGGGLGNTRKFIKSSEVGAHPLMVISDDWDMKTNRHTIKAIECHNLDVDYVGTMNTQEIPRRARNDLFNLPTAVRK